jgi:hypothetical protein
MTEGEVLAVEVDEEVRDDEDHEDGYAEEDKDQEKVGLVGRKLFNLHGELDASGGWGVECVGEVA